MVQVTTFKKNTASIAQEFDPRTIDYTLTDPSQVATNRLGSFLKAMLDYCITIPGVLLISPLLVLIALMVRLDSPGPIIHRRRVLGRNGRVFYALKFRTMHVNGDEILARYPKLKEELDKNYKLKFDPRVTRVGVILRKYSLDELPQLFNVLAQDMSLIGPRIIAPAEIVKYGPYGATLLTAMPGLTGLWQVSGRSDTSYDDRVNLDMQYIHEWSIWTDIKILFRTPLVILRGDGAY
jgi:lipopolysaccharide/colanic/teichoic acid biosynthesis glycosyltransferase